MDRIFDLRKESDVELIAGGLPVIDEVQYSISRDQFIDALLTLVEVLPRDLPLEYRYGVVPIFNRGGSLSEVVDLGVWLHAVRDCTNFACFAKGFANPTGIDEFHQHIGRALQVPRDLLKG